MGDRHWDAGLRWRAAPWGDDGYGEFEFMLPMMMMSGMGRMAIDRIAAIKFGLFGRDLGAKVGAELRRMIYQGSPEKAAMEHAEKRLFDVVTSHLMQNNLIDDMDERTTMDRWEGPKLIVIEPRAPEEIERDKAEILRSRRKGKVEEAEAVRRVNRQLYWFSELVARDLRATFNVPAVRAGEPHLELDATAWSDLIHEVREARRVARKAEETIHADILHITTKCQTIAEICEIFPQAQAIIDHILNTSPEIDAGVQERLATYKRLLP